PGAGSRLANERAARAQDQPEPAELAHVLAEDLPGAAIADVVVERPPGVGDLSGPVRTAGGAQEGLRDAFAGQESPLEDVGRPGGCAGAGADALALGILREPVEHEAPAVEQDPSEARAPDREGRPRGRPGAVCRPGRRRASDQDREQTRQYRALHTELSLNRRHRYTAAGSSINRCAEWSSPPSICSFGRE